MKVYFECIGYVPPRKKWVYLWKSDKGVSGTVEDEKHVKNGWYDVPREALLNEK